MARAKVLCAIRISEETISNMDSAIRKYNKENIFSITQKEFRRLSIELLSQLILKDMPIPIKIS